MNYSIKQYHNVSEIYSKLDELLSQPIKPIDKTAFENYLKYYGEKCPQSKAMTTEAVKFIPGGVQHNLAFNYPHPLVFTKAEGAYLYDIDNNKYIDFLQAGGPTVLGSNFPVVKQKILELINECGPSTGLFHEYEYKLAESICRIFPSIDLFRMLFCQLV